MVMYISTLFVVTVLTGEFLKRFSYFKFYYASYLNKKYSKDFFEADRCIYFLWCSYCLLLQITRCTSLSCKILLLNIRNSLSSKLFSVLYFALSREESSGRSEQMNAKAEEIFLPLPEESARHIFWLHTI